MVGVATSSRGLLFWLTGRLLGRGHGRAESGGWTRTKTACASGLPRACEPPSSSSTVTTPSRSRASLMEFRYDFPGRFMFHAHVSEFAELGWMGIFDVVEG
jgi:FtsP/CotA-like multicopper oxidase with cupredoxin domain